MLQKYLDNLLALRWVLIRLPKHPLCILALTSGAISLAYCVSAKLIQRARAFRFTSAKSMTHLPSIYPFLDSLKYHPSLVVESTHEHGATSVTFAGARIIDNPSSSRVHFRVYDRSLTMPFHVVKYIYGKSLAPLHIFRGVITSLAHNYLRQSSIPLF